MSMQYISRVGAPLGGEAVMIPAKPSLSTSNPVVGFVAGYPLSGSNGLSALAMKPVTPCPGPVPRMINSVAPPVPDRGPPGVNTADADVARASTATIVATTTRQPRRNTTIIVRMLILRSVARCRLHFASSDFAYLRSLWEWAHAKPTTEGDRRPRPALTQFRRWWGS